MTDTGRAPGVAGQGETRFGQAVMPQAMRFALIGMFNTGLDVGVFWLLVHLGHWPWLVAQCVSYTCGLVNSYLCNRTFTFRQQAHPSLREALRFAAVNGLSCGLSLALLAILRHAGWPALGVKMTATGLTTVVNFAGGRWWVFRSRPIR
ncbi:GtrA family protein [Alicyclobacillus shizuokensis]|uniref:GtrA family protein n=1 Tax=Alicyclobacillus shizuokensis TaxID=392014 RepID=UPI0009FB5BE2|nr:GtrA family protein [Alicyclobacillus shizuokensis]